MDMINTVNIERLKKGEVNLGVSTFDDDNPVYLPLAAIKGR